MSALDILKRVLQQTPGVRLAVLFGSAAKGTGRYRDLDIGVSLDSDTVIGDTVTGNTVMDDTECIDGAAHWVADEGWTEPDHAGAAFDVLADRGVVDRDTATALRAATGLRNRIAHGYAMLDYERVHREAEVGIPALRRFLVAVADASGAAD